MDTSAVLMNDSLKTIYPYSVQLPYFKIAFREFREYLELSSSPVTETVSSSVITIPAGVTTLGFNTIPSLPPDLIEIDQAWEVLTGSTPFVPMTRLDFLPHYLEGSSFNQFIYWAWNGQAMQFLPSAQANDIKLDYIRELMNIEGITQNSIINVINATTFLAYRTAGLLTQYIAFDDARAGILNNDASVSLDRAIGIQSKGRQAIYTRHRPFRAGWKSRGLW
jgi:hypothetical protein